MTKEELQNLLDYFKMVNNQGNNIINPIEKLELFSGEKPSGYYAPNMFIGSNSNPESMHLHEKLRMTPAWFVEIWVDGICVFRESRMSNRGEDPQKFEQGLIDNVVKGIFVYGLFTAWQDTIKRYEKMV